MEVARIRLWALATFEIGVSGRSLRGKAVLKYDFDWN